MSYKNISAGYAGKHPYPLKFTYSRHKPNGLDKNTVLEGSALESRKSATLSTKSSLTVRKDSNDNSKTVETENWRNKYASLQRQVKCLRKELEMKDKVISELKKQIEVQDESNGQELEKLNCIIQEHKKNLKICQNESDLKIKNLTSEKNEHENNAQNLKTEINSLKNLHAETLSSLQKDHQRELKDLKEKFNKRINEMKDNHSNAIRHKDITIENLKETVASNFSESSKERQNQIDELVKELKRVSEEAEYVKSALRKFKTSDCSRCHMYQEKFKEVSIQLSEKEGICKNLYLVCSKMEKQLSQKQDLLELWNTVKSFDLTN